MIAGMEGLDPYRPPRADTVPETRRGGRPVLGSLGARFAAALIDGVLHYVLTLGPMLVFATQPVQEVSLGRAREIFLWTLGGGGAYALCQAIAVVSRSASLGKLCVGLIVRRYDGRPASLVQLLCFRPVLQYLAIAAALVDLYLPVRMLERTMGLASLAVGLVAFVDIVAIFGTDRRCLHDLFAGTSVYTASSVRGVATSTQERGDFPRTGAGQERREIG